MELICQYCGKKYYRTPSHAKNSKFCSRECHDKGKIYKRYGTKKIDAVQLRLEKRLSVSDIAEELGIPYRVVASYVKKYPLTSAEKNAIRNRKLSDWRSSKWPISNKALKQRLGIDYCETENCRWTQTLELHHINGNNKDNSRENLQVLCPNHHSITPNFRNNKRE